MISYMRDIHTSTYIQHMPIFHRMPQVYLNLSDRSIFIYIYISIYIYIYLHPLQRITTVVETLFTLSLSLSLARNSNPGNSKGTLLEKRWVSHPTSCRALWPQGLVCFVLHLPSSENFICHCAGNPTCQFLSFLRRCIQKDTCMAIEWFMSIFFQSRGFIVSCIAARGLLSSRTCKPRNLDSTHDDLGSSFPKSRHWRICWIEQI